MRVYVLLFHIFILLNASEQFELESSLAQILSYRTRPPEENIDFYKNFKKNHLLNQLLSKQDSVNRITNSNAACFKAIEYLLNDNLNGESFQFFDAWGSLPAGILRGHLIDIGNFNECLSARATIKSVNQEIRGKYVLVKAAPAVNITSIGNGDDRFAFKIGTCFPSTCSDENVRNIFKTSIGAIAGWTGIDPGIRIDLSIPYSKMEDEHKSYNAASITALCVFSILGTLILVSTLYEYFMMKMTTPSNQLLIAFSLLTNSRKLFHISTNSTSNNIECLNGLRVISMMWIIYGHSHIIFVAKPLINTFDVLSYFQTPFSMLFQASPFAVDSFLLISGVLLTWVALPKMEKAKGKLNIPVMYFHRYIRLTPVVAASILFVVGIWPLIDKGPMLQDWEVMESRCLKNSWINFLYINNYLKPTEMCLDQSWYLAVDMQLFYISPFLLMGLYKWKSTFLWIFLLIAVLSIGCCLMTMITNNFNGIIVHGLYNIGQIYKIHIPTHIRIPTWLIGVALGYWLHCNQQKAPRSSGIYITIGWIVALLLMITVIFVPYHFSKSLSQATTEEAALFAAFGRIAWSLGLSWIIFACHTGYSSTLNSFLSHPCWQPIVRLTYTMYIVSMIVQSINAAYNRTDAYYSVYNVLQSYLGELITTMGWSVLVVLALESPIIALEKFLLVGKKNTSRKSEKTS